MRHGLHVGCIGLVITTFILAGLVHAVAADPNIASTQASSAGTIADAPPIASQRFPQPVRVGDLLRRLVLQPIESQPELGRVRSVVQRPNGMIEIVIDYGGFLGFFTRIIAVPVEGVALLGEYLVVVGFTPQQLDQFVTFNDGGTATLPPDATIKVGLAKPPH